MFVTPLYLTEKVKVMWWYEHFEVRGKYEKENIVCREVVEKITKPKPKKDRVSGLEVTQVEKS